MGAKLALLLWLAAASASGGSVRGRIVTDDGMPLPASAAVTLRCDTLAGSEVAIGPEGWFEFANVPDSPDCTATVTAPGYRPAALDMTALPADPQIPAAALHRLGKSHGESISVTHLAAPAAAKLHFHAAMRIQAQEAPGGIAEALDELQRAVKAYPAYAQAWFEIGRLQLALGDATSAVSAFRESVRADPWFVSPYEPLMLLLEASGDTAGAKRACEGLRRINPALPSDCGGG